MSSKRETTGSGTCTAEVPDEMIRVRFETDATVLDGDRVMEKSATGSARSALRREASVLAQINSRFAIRFVELREANDRTAMVTLDAGSRTLARAARLSTQELLRALGECVEAVREFQANGWQHGSLSPDHVIVGARGRIRLCSFGAAIRLPADESLSATDTRDCRSPVDVASLIRLVSDVAGQEPIEDRWLDRRRRTQLNRHLQGAATTANEILLAGGSTSRILASLTGAIGQANEAGTLKPSQRAVPGSGALRAFLDHARSGTTPHPKQPDRRSGQRRTRHAAVGLITAAVVVGVLVLRVDSSTGTAKKADSPGLSPGPMIASTGSYPPPSVSRPGPVSEPNVIAVDETLYSIGEEGDITTAGKWHCTDTVRVLLLRPSTGEVFVFDRLARPEAAVTGRLVAVHAGAVRIHNRVSDCEVPVLEMRNSRSIELARETIEEASS